jgi:hypothetical protein
MKMPLWGCPGMNFKYSLPFFIMRQAYANFERDPLGPAANVYSKS